MSKFSSVILFTLFFVFAIRGEEPLRIVLNEIGMATTAATAVECLIGIRRFDGDTPLAVEERIEKLKERLKKHPLVGDSAEIRTIPVSVPDPGNKLQPWLDKAVRITIPLKPGEAKPEFYRSLYKAVSETLEISQPPGSNEGMAITACMALAEAQFIYRRTDYNGDGVLEFAQSLNGENSLLEKKAGAADIGLIDKSLAAAESAPGKVPVPRNGYFFKVLKGQNSDPATVESGTIKERPAGGVNPKKSYLDNAGHMTQGFAFLAFPAAYGETGRFSYVSTNQSVVYQKDLGPETAKLAESMIDFPIDKTWAMAGGNRNVPGQPVSTFTLFGIKPSAPRQELMTQVIADVTKRTREIIKGTASNLGKTSISLRSIDVNPINAPTSVDLLMAIMKAERIRDWAPEFSEEPDRVLGVSTGGDVTLKLSVKVEYELK